VSRFMSLVTVVVSAVVIACGSSTASPGRSAVTTSEVALDREFDLAPGQTARVPSLGLSVRFDAVQNDSRCPQGVACVWAGNAEVRLTLERGGASRQVTVNTMVEPKSVSEGNVTVTLTRLTPGTVAERRIAQGDYRATLLLAGGR
jgi:hypothetical protein